MTEEPWESEIRSEKPSRALAEAFSVSAGILRRALASPSLEFLEQAYRDPNRDPDEAVEEVARVLAAAGLTASSDASKRLLEFAVDEHRDPFRAIAAQAMDAGSAEDQRQAVDLLEELANRAEYAEAALILAQHRVHVPWPKEAREFWHARAAALWPSSVRGLHGTVQRIPALGSYYIAHVLAARRAANGF